ncbi:MAG: hypothetical protein H0T88_12100, partial [Lysobacter sp.]|nr:hypothetical protein [Lysobacter sp.]
MNKEACATPLRWILITTLLMMASGLLSAGSPSAATQTPAQRHIYYTGGVHNDKGCRPPELCIHTRKPGEPTDPVYPAQWISNWTMYRVFNNFDKYPPPYTSPPAGLTPADYQVSYG